MHMHLRPVQNYGVPDIAASGAATQQAAERARVAETRRRLAKGAAQLSQAGSPEEEFLIGQWLGREDKIALEGDEYRPGGNRDEGY